MKYDAIANLFLTSNASDWERVSGNHEYAFCTADVNLRIVSTLADSDIQQEDFRATWANGFADPAASGYFYNLYYGSTLLRRFILVSVDGARASLPVPEAGTNVVTQAQWKVAEIFDSLDTLDDYAAQAGLVRGTNPGM